jgi:hypothetical protein
MANPRILFALDFHVRFGNLDFICMGVDYDLVLLPPNVDVDAISEALSSLHMITDEGQALENDHQEVLGAEQGRPVSHMTTRGPVASLRP